MEKILVLLDSREPDLNTIGFACYLARLTNSNLTGIFLENATIDKEITMVATAESDVLIENVSVRRTKVGGNGSGEENIRVFLEAAEQEGVQASYETNGSWSSAGVIQKTRFADVLVLHAKVSSDDMDDGVPSGFVKEILQGSVCPVIIAPDNFQGIDHIIFCYNGMKSSIFAIKQFIYLFPELKNKLAQVIDLETYPKSSAEEIAEFINWLNYHYQDVAFAIPENRSAGAVFHHLSQKKNSIVVMGAYGKGLLNSFFEPTAGSFSTGTTSIPLFISH